MNIKQLANMFLDTAKTNLSKDKFLQPLAVFVKVGYEHVLFPFNFDNDKLKEFTKGVIQGLILKTKPDYVFIVSDIYFAQCPENEVDDYPSVSARPDHCEALCVIWGSITETGALILPYTKTNNEITYGNVMEMDKAIDISFFGNAFDILARENTKFVH